MIFGRQYWVLLDWKRWTRRSWCCRVLWRKLAKDWMRCNPGKAVRWRRRWKTPPGRVLTAAAIKLAPKMSIRLEKAGELKAEHVSRNERNKTQEKPEGHSRHTKKGVIQQTSSWRSHTTHRRRTGEKRKTKGCTWVKGVAEGIPGVPGEVADPWFPLAGNECNEVYDSVDGAGQWDRNDRKQVEALV